MARTRLDMSSAGLSPAVVYTEPLSEALSPPSSLAIVAVSFTGLLVPPLYLGLKF
jgi:hypothetical protein